MPRFVIHRRPARRRTSLTAAAQRVDARNPASFRTASTLGGRHWHEDAWRYLEKVGPLEYYVSWRAASASRCRLLASALDDQGEPTGSLAEDDPNADRVRQIVNDIAGGVSGQTKIVHRMTYLLSVPGECWLGLVVRDAARETALDGNILPVDLQRPGYQIEQWYVFGREEIKAGSNRIELRLPDGTKHEFNDKVDLLFRVWVEHPKDPSQPVSPIWSNREVLYRIVQAGASINNATNSRLIGNGILFVPQEMSLPNQNAPIALPLGETDENAPGPFFEPNAAQQLQDLLFDVQTAAKADPDSLAANSPIIAAVPGEMIKHVNWIRPASDIPETTLKIKESDLRELAVGLHVNPERLLGMSQGNHWSSWLIDETDVKIHIAPVVEVICSALTQEVLRTKLALEDIDPDAYVVWYDSNPLTQDPDKTAEANDAFDRGALTARALREHLGFDDEDGYDLTGVDGWIELALDKVAQDPANAGLFLPIIQAAAEKVGLEVKMPEPVALPQAPAQEEEPADSEPEEPSQEESAPPVTASLTIARMCVDRALELANKRRRTRADSAAYRGVPIQLAHTRLDPVPLLDAAELIKGWTTGVVDDDLRALGLNPENFRIAIEASAMFALATSSPPLVTPAMLRGV